jgi:molecular chaperone DnaK
MTRKFLSIGIDHGTTNSGLAFMDGDRPVVIKPDGVERIMSSAVYIDKRGRILVGQSAVKAMRLNPAEDGNGFTGYKLRIGQDDCYEFRAAGKVKTAQELGGIVISELLKFYREEKHDDPKAAVITVPAKFNQSDYDGTRRAALMAGLQYCPLLMEPIAAALAYGFTTEDERAQWMIFDLGGGTLDVSLVMVRNGKMIVPEEGHAGYPYLGGRKFDRELLSYVLSELNKKYALQSFSETSQPSAWGRLMLAVEEAKIELSRREQAVVNLPDALCKDEAGKDVEVYVPITRAQYEHLIAADVEKAILVCQNLLRQNQLTAGDINRLILIGGPTKTPYLQKVLNERLGIKLDSSIDPMTAVALGAAIYATTLEIPTDVDDDSKGFDASAISLNLQYERKSNLPTAWVSGEVNNATAEGELSIEIRRSDGGWESGRLPLDENGVFSTEVVMVARNRPYLSHFTTMVLNQAGRVLTQAEEPEIWYPFPIDSAAIRLASSLRVALVGNATDILIKRGAELPIRKGDTYYTAKPIRQGSKEDVLRIPVLESVTHLLGSEDDHADCNFHVGTLKIIGSDERVTSDLPQGSEVDLEIYQDESRSIRAVAYIPLLATEFEAKFEPEAFVVDLENLGKRFEQLQLDIEEMKELQAERPLPLVGEALERVTNPQVIESINNDLERAKAGERDAIYRVYKSVLELAGTLNQIRELQKIARIQNQLAALERTNEATEKNTLQEIKQEFSTALANDDKEAISHVEKSLGEMDLRLRKKPYIDVLLDLLAISGRHISASQAVQFDKADALMNSIELKGGIKALTDSEIAQLESLHADLMLAFPDLAQWREEALARIGGGFTDLEISDIVKNRPIAG